MTNHIFQHVYKDGDEGFTYDYAPGRESAELTDVIRYIDAAPSWDCVEPEVWQEICKALGLEYGDYDDPDRLWSDIMTALDE